VLFTVARPTQTLIGGAVIALGIPVSWIVIRRPSRAVSARVGALGDQ